MKQDMNGVRTAQDLEQKYNLSAIEEIKKETQKNTQQINSTNNELKDFTTQVTKDLGELQDQIDGNIMTWFLSGVPTLSNPPANEWTTNEEKNNHLGDLYYDKDTGYAYRFTLENGVYNWLKLTDSDIAEALAIANSAKDIADSKRRVFLEQPNPPYDNGDMWIKDKEIYICQISKAEGEQFAENDFINSLKYTDDTYAIQVGNDLKVVSGTVLEIKNDVDEYSRTLTETQTLVNEQGEEIGILNEKYTNIEQTTNSLTITVGETSSKANELENEISSTNTNLENNYQEITEKLDNYVPQNDFDGYKEQIQGELNNTYNKNEVDQKLSDGSVSMVKTTSGTFDADGLTIDSNTSPVKNLLAPNGMIITDKTGSSDTELLFAGYDEDLHETIVRSKNMVVEKYFTVAENSRIEQYETGAGIFWVGD